jgi:hypothetical protein
MEEIAATGSGAFHEHHEEKKGRRQEEAPLLQLIPSFHFHTPIDVCAAPHVYPHVRNERN